MITRTNDSEMFFECLSEAVALMCKKTLFGELSEISVIVFVGIMLEW